MFTFNPTAQTINPYDLTFNVRYSLRCAAKLNNLKLDDDYNIGVSPLRTQSTVSTCTLTTFIEINFCMGHMLYKCI